MSTASRDHGCVRAAPKPTARKPDEKSEEIIAEDRGRIAAELHDLVMQDVSFALARARMLADEPAIAADARAVVAACERALEGARRMLGALTAVERKPVAEALEASVRAAARDTTVAFRVARIEQPELIDAPTYDALVHIGREAVTNAVKHAGSNAEVEVVFERDEEWRLTVRDKGRGFDPAAASAGFGLQSMRAQASGLGGSLHVTSEAGRGSVVQAVLP